MRLFVFACVFPGYKATNFFVKFVYGENIMGYKIAGEEALRDAYTAANKPGVAYTVIRPGGLSDGASVGPSKIHISQGDGKFRKEK